MEDIGVHGRGVGDVAAFYAGRGVLVTGATGLLGKVLVEKLLWAVPNVGNVYMLMRPKRGKTASERLAAIQALPVFDRVRRDCPEQLDKMKMVAGDVGLDKLGIGADDMERIQEVSVVVHCAATLKLDGSLKDALHLNTRGTQRALEVAKTLPHLTVFVHTSTAFCNCDFAELAERVYPPPISPEHMMGCADLVDDVGLEDVTKHLLAPHPNTYTYSKRLAEDLVARQYPDLPVCIVRPSIVCPSWEEPVPGWVDNLNGPVGVMAAAGKGVIRSMYCRADYNAEVIPLDFAVNSTLVAAFRVATSPREPSVPVFNLTSGKWRQATWGEVLDHGRRAGYMYPFEMILWYPDGNIRPSRLSHDVHAFFQHFLPAYFIDFMMFIFRQPRFMVRIYKRIAVGLELLQFFTTRQWVFHNDRFMALWRDMSPADRRLFNFDVTEVKISDYIDRCLLGARQYCLKEDPATIPRQRRLLKVYYAADRLIALLFYGLLAWYVYGLFASAAPAASTGPSPMLADRL
ncbi:putative fatty acyl-CoA reductase CG5065 isoform X2 [Thrips palmi]|uniref:Fatty acyl-CoA reductase n=1 Tax=Thrips palmi TaxID=161013 RepID=A0A6P9AF27_THRPL|nr:putative fatty acyl-CoA reductase CG5065 isoform X2 [Thrips palmi]